jgi:hypothetical protein
MKTPIKYLCYLAIPLFLMGKCGTNHGPIPIDIPVNGDKTGSEQTDGSKTSDDNTQKDHSQHNMKEAVCFIKVMVSSAKDGSAVQSAPVSCLDKGSNLVGNGTTNKNGIVIFKGKISTAYVVSTTKTGNTYKESIITPPSVKNDTVTITFTVDNDNAGTTAIGVIVMDDDRTKPAAGVTVQLIETVSQTMQSAVTYTNGTFTFATAPTPGKTYRLRSMMNNTFMIDTTFTFLQAPIIVSFHTK